MDDLAPARKILRSRRSNTGYLPSTKVSSGFANYESRIERDFYLLLNHDQSVEQFQPQPETLRWVDPLSHQAREYTPDVLVITRQGKRYLIEIKEEADITEHADSYRDKWIAADMVAKQRGWDFYILTDKMIRTPRLNNVWFCLGASRAFFHEGDKITTKLLAIVKECKDGIGYKSLCMALARALGIAVDKAACFVCYAIYFGLIWIDTFSSMAIGADTVIRVFSSQTPCFCSLFEEIKPLSVKDTYTSREQHESEIKPVCDGEGSRFPQVPSKYDTIVVDRERIVKIWIATPPSHRTAEWRCKFEQQVGTSRRTIEGWVKRYEQDGVGGLVPDTRERVAQEQIQVECQNCSKNIDRYISKLAIPQ